MKTLRYCLKFVRQLRLIIFVLFIFCTSESYADDTYAGVSKNDADAIAPFVESQNFNKLEEIAEQRRSSSERFAWGNSKLGQFYNGVSEGSSRVNQKNVAAFDRFLSDWEKSKPNSITPKILRTNAELSYAWAARGSGYANTVSHGGAELFGQHLTNAAKIIAPLIKQNVKDGHAYYNLLRIGRGLGLPDAELRRIFEQGVKLAPTYWPLYAERALELDPKWGGAPGEVEDFADSLIQLNPAGDGQALYINIAFWAYQNCKKNEFLHRTRFSYEKIKSSGVDLNKKYPHPLNMQKVALFAVLFQDKETAANAFQKLGSVWNSDAELTWGTFDFYKSSRAWALNSGTAILSTDLHRAALNGEGNKISELLKSGADINATDLSGQTPLMVAAGKSQNSVAQFLIESGADISKTTKDGYTALHIAARSGNLEMVKYLTSHAADIAATNQDGLTAVHFAAGNGFSDIVTHLCKQLPSVANLKTKSGRTPLHYATMNGHLDTAASNIEINPGSLNERDVSGSTPLHYAATFGDPKVVELLLEKGANAELKDFQARTAFDRAKEKQHEDVARILEKRIAK